MASHLKIYEVYKDMLARGIISDKDYLLATEDLMAQLGANEDTASLNEYGYLLEAKLLELRRGEEELERLRGVVCSYFQGIENEQGKDNKIIGEGLTLLSTVTSMLVEKYGADNPMGQAVLAEYRKIFNSITYEKHLVGGQEEKQARKRKRPPNTPTTPANSAPPLFVQGAPTLVPVHSLADSSVAAPLQVQSLRQRQQAGQTLAQPTTPQAIVVRTTDQENQANEYMASVKKRFLGKPEFSRKFKKILDNCKRGMLSMQNAAYLIGILFQGHLDLIMGFNNFLQPSERKNLKEDAIGWRVGIRWSVADKYEFGLIKDYCEKSKQHKWVPENGKAEFNWVDLCRVQTKWAENKNVKATTKTAASASSQVKDASESAPGKSRKILGDDTPKESKAPSRIDEKEQLGGQKQREEQESTLDQTAVAKVVVTSSALKQKETDLEGGAAAASQPKPHNANVPRVKFNPKVEYKQISEELSKETTESDSIGGEFVDRAPRIEEQSSETESNEDEEASRTTVHILPSPPSSSPEKEVAVIPLKFWEKVAQHLHRMRCLSAFAMTCKKLKYVQNEVSPRNCCTNLRILYRDKVPLSQDWFRWVISFTERTDRKARELIFDLAISQGHVNLLPMLQSKGCLLHKSWTCYASTAASNGHIEVLKWLRMQGCKWDETACMGAAENGHLHVLKYLREQDCAWDKWTGHLAASNGHLNVMKWVIGQGCPMDEGTCEHAALGGHLECLKWLRSQGCPWDKSTTSAAAQGGHLDCVEWAKSNCCPTD